MSALDYNILLSLVPGTFVSGPSIERNSIDLTSQAKLSVELVLLSYKFLLYL